MYGKWVGASVGPGRVERESLRGYSAAAVVNKAFATMDKWLHSIELDTSANPLEVKVVNNKPPEAVDFCRGQLRCRSEAFDRSGPLTQS